MRSRNISSLTLQGAEKYSYKNVLSSNPLIGVVSVGQNCKWDPILNSVFNDIHQITADYYVDPNIISETKTWFKTVQGAVDQAVYDEKKPTGKFHIYIELSPSDHEGLIYVPKLVSNGRAIPITIFSRQADPASTVVYANIDAEMSGEEYASKFKSIFKNSPKSIRDIYERIAKLDKITTANASVLRIENNECRAFNFTVKNTYNADRPALNVNGDVLENMQRNKAGQFEDGQHQAVAVMVAGADKVHLENLRLCSFQDTLYLKTPDDNGEVLGKTSRTYIRNCYIEGDVDFIFGQAIAYFTGCKIRTLGTRTKKSWVVAPATNIRSKYGFVFDDCDFVSDQSAASQSCMLSFGRQWFEGVRATPYGVSPIENYNCDIGGISKFDGANSTISQATLEAVGKCVIMNSRIGPHLNRAALWGDWNGGHFTVEGDYVPAKWHKRFRPVQKNVRDFIINLKAWKPELVSNYNDLDLEDVFLGEFNNYYIAK